jgi:hypothetical protein
VVGARVGKIYYTDDLPSSVALQEGGLASKVIDTQVQIVQDKFLVKELINKTYSNFDAYLVKVYKFDSILNAPIHTYEEYPREIRPGETREFSLTNAVTTKKSWENSIQYGLKIAREWGSSAKIPVENLEIGVSSKETVEQSVFHTLKYGSEISKTSTSTDKVQITNDTKQSWFYKWQLRARFNVYFVQVFKIEYQRNEWKSSSPFDFTTYYGYDNLGRMRLVEGYATYSIDDTRPISFTLDRYVENNNGRLVIDIVSPNKNEWMV